jgi:apolipoprotein N-acyltransferase
MTRQHATRSAYLWLLLGASLGFVTQPALAAALAAWLAPVFVLRFTRTTRWWIGYLLLAVVSTLIAAIVWYGKQPLPLPVHIVTMSIASAIGALPYLADRLLAPRLRNRAGDMRFISTLLFPCGVTALEFLSLTTSPLGTFGAQAYSQYGLQPIMQLSALTGLWGITFIMSWLAAVVNWAWAREFHWASIGRSVTAYAMVLLAVIGYGVMRLAVAPALDEGQRSVNVASFTAAEFVPATLFPLLEQDPTAFRAETQAVHTAYLEQSRTAAQNGAELILWPEGAGIGLEEDVAALVEQGRILAQEEALYLAMPIFTLYPNQERPAENRLLIADPTGDIVLDHVKYGGNQFEGTLAGNRVLPTVETPFGTLSGVICWDADFPAVIRQAGAQDVDVLLIPARDWEEIDPLHGEMSVFRGVENGLTIVRQADGGLSLVADPYGRVLTAYSHWETADWTQRAQAPTVGVPTFYSRAGDWVGWLSAVGFVLLAGWALLAGRRRPVASTDTDGMPALT